ncbi:MAG: hypothetical protein R6X08_09190 [Desulfosalsimonadaceae bacterium]
MNEDKTEKINPEWVQGRNIGFGDARIENEAGKLIAHGTTTVMVQQGVSLNNNIDNIFKYL